MVNTDEIFQLSQELVIRAVSNPNETELNQFGIGLFCALMDNKNFTDTNFIKEGIDRMFNILENSFFGDETKIRSLNAFSSLILNNPIIFNEYHDKIMNFVYQGIDRTYTMNPEDSDDVSYCLKLKSAICEVLAVYLSGNMHKNRNKTELIQYVVNFITTFKGTLDSYASYGCSLSRILLHWCGN